MSEAAAAGGRGPDHKRVSKSSRAGLQFPVGRVSRKLRRMRDKEWKRVSEGAPVYLTVALEYLAAEMLELSGNVAKDEKKKLNGNAAKEEKKTRISPRHVLLAIRNDKYEVNKLVGRNTTIASGGVIEVRLQITASSCRCIIRSSCSCVHSAQNIHGVLLPKKKV